MLMEPQKFKDSAGLVSGDFVIPGAGSLEVAFDNRYSILRSKTFDYIVEVKSGEEGPNPTAGTGGGGEALLPGGAESAPEPEAAEALLPGA